MSNNEKWEKVGVVGVDAGLVLVGDPCYFLHREVEGKQPYQGIGKDWTGFCDLVTGDAAQLNYDPPQPGDVGSPGLGVVVQPAGGDGTYDVLVRRNSRGEVAEVRVVFEAGI